jgi:bifunctional non-homologous end joining protein LigD
VRGVGPAGGRGGVVATVMARFPTHVKPMLATTGTLPVPRLQPNYAFEVKWDGVRAISYVRDGTLHLESRNLLDITPRYPELAGLARALSGREALLDGEVVAFGPDGKPSFGVLQTRMHVAAASEVRRRMADAPVAYLVFDVLWVDGGSLMDRPWHERRAVLDSLGLGAGDEPWRVPATHVGDGTALLEATKTNGLEGVVAKHTDSIYEPGRRSRAWIKVKNVNRQELVVGGWLPGEGNRANRLGALLVGYYDDGGALHYAGRVGSGFTDAELTRLGALLAPLATDANPFTQPVPVPRGLARYVEPRLVADVDFGEWTQLGTLRHPRYKGLRDDKAPEDVRREPVS